MSKNYKNKQYTLSHRIGTTVLILLAIRLFYSIPTPGVNTQYFSQNASSGNLFGFLNILSGNGLSSLSVMALNITPYITASIIIQLLENVFTKLHDMRRGMKDDQDRIEKITVAFGAVLSFIQGAAMATGYGRSGLLNQFTWYWVIIISAVWAMGTFASVLLGRLIQKKYDFNGISLILLCNILSSYPAGVYEIYQVFVKGKVWYYAISAALITVVIVFLLFCFTYVIQESEKTIKVNYTGKGQMINGGRQVSSLPIKMCPGGVIPVVFASTIMSIPVMIAGFFSSSDLLWVRILSQTSWFRLNDMMPTIGVFIYVALIFGFSFFYAYMVLNPHDLAETLQKGGGMISGIRPGRPTEKYLKRQMKGVVAIGAIALTVIALVPVILSGIFGLSQIPFLGTSIIITVGVICEVKQKLSASRKAYQYVGKGKNKGGLF